PRAELRPRPAPTACPGPEGAGRRPAVFPTDWRTPASAPSRLPIRARPDPSPAPAATRSAAPPEETRLRGPPPPRGVPAPPPGGPAVAAGAGAGPPGPVCSRSSAASAHTGATRRGRPAG